jgi:plastocyanin domain-containing protein
MIIKKATLYILGIIILVAVAGFFIFRNGGSSTGNVIGANNQAAGDVQDVIMGLKNYNYYPNTIRVKADQPVSISLDSSAVGCSRFLTIPQLKLSKNLATPSDTLVFTPKKGTYRFACGMGMYYGTLIVE